MDNEEKTNGPQKPDGFTPSIERMTEKLETVFSTAMQALQVAPKLESGGHKWMVLSKAIGEIRHVLGPCAIMPDACFHKLHEFVSTPPASGTGAFFTPKQAIDFIMGNPPFGEVKDVPTPIDPNAPQIAQGEEPWRKIDDTESVGVRYSGNVILAWVVHERTSVTVRAVRIYADGKPSNCWQIVASVDCEKAVIATVFGGRNRAEEVCKKIRNALIAVRLRGRHYRMNVQARKAKAAEEVPNA